MVAPNGWSAIKKFYDWDERFMADLRQWEARMMLVEAPSGVGFTYDGAPSRGVRVHGTIAREFSACLLEIRDADLWRFVAAHSGGYNFRAQRGASVVSMHAMGAAVDFDAEHNPFRRVPEETALGTEPGLGVVRIFEARGWTWGGRWGRSDCMHFQFASGM